MAERSGGGAGVPFRARPRRLLFAAAVLAAALAACSVETPPSGAPPARPAPHAATPARRPALASAALRIPDPGALEGLHPAELRALFGVPELRRVEPPAELWQYRNADCVLEIFLYRDLHGLRVVHSDLHDRNGRRGGASSCARAVDSFAQPPRHNRL